MTSTRLTIGLGPNGQMQVYLPGASNSERTISLPLGKESELLFQMLLAQQQGLSKIESMAEPTQSLTHHVAKHSRANAMGQFVRGCAHCEAEQEQRAATKVQRKEERTKKASLTSILKLLEGLPEADKQKFINQLEGTNT